MLATATYLNWHNTPLDNGNWTCVKIQQYKDVLGIPFVVTRTALHRNRMNLAAWLGFQELLYAKKVTPRQIDFQFFVPQDTYVVLIYNKQPDGFSGVRLSNYPQFPSMHFRAGAEGRFLEKSPLESLSIRSGKNNCKLQFDETHVSLIVNRQPIRRWREPVSAQQQIGFRGSLNDCYIDNVCIESADGTKFRDTFSNTRDVGKVMLPVIVAIAFLNGIAAVVIAYGGSMLDWASEVTRRTRSWVGSVMCKRQLSIAVAAAGLMWPLLVMLVMHKSFQPTILGRWSERRFTFILVGAAVVLGWNFLVWQASRSESFAHSWLGRLLDGVRKRTVLRAAAAVTPWIALLIVGRLMVKLNMQLTPRVAVSVLFVTLILVCCELLLLTPTAKVKKKTKPPPRSPPLARLTLMNVTLLLCAVTMFTLDYWFLAMLYPRQDLIDNRGLTTFLELEEHAVERVRNEYSEDKGEKFRVLVIGTSQTWGAGIARQGDEIASQLERVLNAQAGDSKSYQCINSAVPGSNATMLYELFQRHWVSLNPDLIVLNLSFNDTDVEILIRQLENFVELSQRHGIGVVFSLEPNTIEAPPQQQRAKHDAMRELARSHDVPVVDMQSHLDEVYDVGFLWWDRVHLTSLGSLLFAEHLGQQMLREQVAVSGTQE